MRTFKIGQRVEFDGSGDRRYPRWYCGVVTAIRADGAVVIKDHEWFAISTVNPNRVRHIVDVWPSDYDAFAAWQDEMIAKMVSDRQNAAAQG